jgi:ABC-type Mn2+/Zn2+ transport system permease subunit
VDDVGRLAWEVVLISVASIPLALSVWALLDIARRPAWAWGLSGRNRVIWMAAVLVGMCSVVGGMLISGYYLLRVRPAVADAEQGRFGTSPPR